MDDAVFRAEQGFDNKRFRKEDIFGNGMLLRIYQDEVRVLNQTVLRPEVS